LNYALGVLLDRALNVALLTLQPDMENEIAVFEAAHAQLLVSVVQSAPQILDMYSRFGINYETDLQQNRTGVRGNN